MAAKLDLDPILARKEELEALLAEPGRQDIVQLSRALAELRPVTEAIGRFRAAEGEVAGLDGLLADVEMRELAAAELPEGSADDGEAAPRDGDADAPAGDADTLVTAQTEEAPVV